MLKLRRSVMTMICALPIFTLIQAGGEARAGDYNMEGFVFFTNVLGAAQKGALAYVVSKHGMIGLVTGMAMDEAEHGVRVLGVAPGSVDTPMLRDAINLDPNPAALNREVDAMHPLGRRARPEEVANVIAFLLSEQASFMTGETVRVDGGLMSRIPGCPKTEVEPQ